MNTLHVENAVRAHIAGMKDGLPVKIGGLNLANLGEEEYILLNVIRGADQGPNIPHYPYTIDVAISANGDEKTARLRDKVIERMFRWTFRDNYIHLFLTTFEGDTGVETDAETGMSVTVLTFSLIARITGLR